MGTYYSYMSSSWTVLNTTFGKTNISFMAWQTLVHAIIASLDWLEHRQWNCKSISLSRLLPAHENLVIISLKRSFIYFQFDFDHIKFDFHLGCCSHGKIIIARLMKMQMYGCEVELRVEENHKRERALKCFCLFPIFFSWLVSICLPLNRDWA